jgi:hypothetical protein
MWNRRTFLTSLGQLPLLSGLLTAFSGTASAGLSAKEK